MVASLMLPGSLSVLTYAHRIIIFIASVVLVPLPIVFFPKLIEKTSSDSLSFQETLMKGIRMSCFITFPTVALLIALSKPCIKLLFSHGAFEQEAVQMTALAVSIMSLNLLAHSVAGLLNRALFAFKKTGAIVVAISGAQILTIGANFLFAFWWGYLGLAASIAIQPFFLLGLYAFFLKEQVRPKTIFFDRSILKTSLSALGVGLVVYGAYRVMSEWVIPVSIGKQLVGLGIPCVLGGFGYLGLSFLMGSGEARKILEYLSHWVSRKAALSS